MSPPLLTLSNLRQQDPFSHGMSLFLALLGIVAAVVTGAALGHLIGPPMTFILLTGVLVFWAVAGWFLGWRAVMAGLAALIAALTTAYGMYGFALACAGSSFFFLFANILPRNGKE